MNNKEKLKEQFNEKNFCEQFDFLVSHNGIVDVFTQKCMNTKVLNYCLLTLQNNGYKLYKVFDDYIRAVK